MTTDAAFVDTVTGAADAVAAALIDRDAVDRDAVDRDAVDRYAVEGASTWTAPLATAPLGPHREAMRRIKLLVAVWLAPGSAYRGDARALQLAGDYARRLRGMQSASGLFVGGNNVESPPDSGFTINDLGDTLELLRSAGDHDDLAPLRDVLRQIAERATPAMLRGGVHTPNHRWELSAALARLLSLRRDGDRGARDDDRDDRDDIAAALRARIDEWLAEGVDIDDDGLYSERSANYAVYVSNPSLLAIAEVLGRPELYDAVERNLTALLGLIHPDDSVETVHSRRQDQKDPRFPLAPFAMLLRRLAIERDRGDFAWAAQRALAGGVAEPQNALAELLRHPVLRETPPPAVAPGPGRRAWRGSGLVVDATPVRTLVVYGGSDYAAFRRIRSGLATNPTFLRLFAGSAILDSVRLSRDFFGLGPFRADALVEEAGGFALTEVLEPGYYQPLAPERRRLDGRYDVEDEGRFAAAMSFSDRETDAVRLRTRIDVRPIEGGVELVVDTDGPQCGWNLELAFREGGVFEGVSPQPDGTAVLEEGWARYRAGDDVIEFGPAPGAGPGGSRLARYVAGEDYDYLGGTDAMAGPRAYLTGRTPGIAHVTIRRVG